MYEPWSLDAAAGRSVAPARFWPVVAARGDAPRPRRSRARRAPAPRPSAPPRLGPAVAAGDASGPTWTDERVTRVRPGAGCHASAANRRRATGPVRSGARGRPNLRVATVSNHTGNRTVSHCRRNHYRTRGRYPAPAAPRRPRRAPAETGARRRRVSAKFTAFRGRRGLTTITPAYPGMSGEFEEGRKSKKGVTHASLERVVSEGRRPRARDLR